MDRRRRRFVCGTAVALAAVLVLASCGKKAEEHHQDRATPQETPTETRLAVSVGGAKSTWGAAEFAKAPKAGAANKSGAERDVWSLRELVRANVGPNARVVSVTGASGTQAIDAAAWADADKTPIVHSTRRGTLKFRWTDKTGAWIEPSVNDVTAIEVAP